MRQRIKELQTFEDQDLEVRISVDDGETHSPVSLVVKLEGRLCVLVSCGEPDP